MFGRFLALSLILLVLAVGALSGCGVLRTDTEEFDQTYTVTAGTKIDISNTDGDISVTAWDIAGSIEVSAIKSTSWGTAELEQVEIQVDNDTAGTTKIETKVQKNARVSVSYAIKVPRNSVLDTVTTAAGKISLDGVSGEDVTITTSDGGIYVKGGSGEITATSSNGKIELDGTSGEATLVTSNGDILVMNKKVGNITAATSNGKIEIKDSKGDVTLDSSNGAIYVDNLDGYVLRAKTSNGAIDITRTTGIIMAETSNYNVTAEISNVRDLGTTIKTSRGSIALYLSASLNASLEMKTTSGQIIIHPTTINIGQSDSNYLKGTLGAGGSSIYVETTNGDIEVSKLEPSA